MLFRAGVLVALALWCGAGSGDESSRTVRGRVADQHGAPIANADVGTYWNANGVSFNEVKRFEASGGDDRVFEQNEGHMQPWGRQPVSTNAAGRFAIEVGRRDSKLLIMDEQREHGALVMFDSPSAPEELTVTLKPLSRLQGRVVVAATGQPATSTTVVVRVPWNKMTPLATLRLAACSSRRSVFDFRLPPGEYQLEAFGHEPEGHQLVPLQPVTLTAEGPQTPLVLRLVPEALQPLQVRARQAAETGKWIDLKKRYGQPAPGWHAEAARGISTDARLAEFRGRWVLVYLWSPSCAPCLGKTLPALSEFYRQHRGQRDQFEIVAVCLDKRLKTLADYDRVMEPVVSSVWDGERLPFPLVLDPTLATAVNYGVKGLGQAVLINPDGRLVEGDERTLQAMLEE